MNEKELLEKEMRMLKVLIEGLLDALGYRLEDLGDTWVIRRGRFKLVCLGEMCWGGIDTDDNC